MLTAYDVMPKEFQDALADKLTTDLAIRDSGHGFITRMGGHIDVGECGDKVPLMLCLAAAQAGTVINDEKPSIKFSLKDNHGRLGMQRWLGKRPEVGGGWSVTIRIPIGKRLSWDEQVEYGTVTRTQADWIDTRISVGDSGIVVGGMGSGKSTLLNTMLGSTSLEPKVMVKLERVEELINTTNCSTYLIGPYCSMSNARDLALSENAKVVVLGEATGGEDMQEVLITMGTGHQSFTTLHADSIANVPDRISDMLRQTIDNRTEEQMHGAIVRNVDFCIFMKEGVNGKRVVGDIASFEMQNGRAVRKEVAILSSLEG